MPNESPKITFTNWMVSLATIILIGGGAMMFKEMVSIGSDVAVIKNSLTDIQSNVQTLQASQRDLEHRLTVIETRVK